MSNQHLQWFSIFSAGMSAVFWFWAAITSIPAIENRMRFGGKSVEGLEFVIDALRKQGKLNACGAIFAAFYTGIQVYLR